MERTRYPQRVPAFFRKVGASFLGIPTPRARVALEWVEWVVLSILNIF